MIYKDYKGFRQGFMAWIKAQPVPRLSCFFGLGPYFEMRVLEHLKDQVGPVRLVDGSQLEFLRESQHGNLFSDFASVAIRNSTQDLLKEVGSELPYPTVLLGAPPPASFLSQWSPPRWTLGLSTSSFRAYEQLDLIADIASHRGISFSRDALFYLASLEASPLAWDAEFRFLRLLYGFEKIQLSLEECQKQVGHLFDEEAFALDRRLCEEAYGKAHLLIGRRLDQGDSPMALLGILVRHIRTVLKIMGSKKTGVSPQSLGIRDFLLKSYQKIAVPKKEPLYEEALRLCQRADILFKTTKVAPDLVLCQILMALE
jgi:hypothetical protein